MTSGYVYKPLRKVLDPNSSYEMHIADQFLANNFDFDEFVRVCSSASSADAVEISALSDLLRQYLLASVVKTRLETRNVDGSPTEKEEKKTKVKEAVLKIESSEEKSSEEESDDEESDDEESDDEESDDEESDDEEDVDEGALLATEIKEEKETFEIREPNLNILNLALQNMIRFLIDDIKAAINRSKEPNNGVEELVADLNTIYAGLGAMAYAHYLTSNGNALMPSDNTYSIDGLDHVRVARASKLYQHIFKNLNPLVPIQQLVEFEIPRLDPAANTKEEYIANYELMISVLEELFDKITETNKALTLTPALGIVTKTYNSKWERLNVLGKIYQWTKEQLQTLPTPRARQSPVVDDKTYSKVIDLKDVAAHITNHDNVPKTFQESQGIPQGEQRDILEKYYTDIVADNSDHFFEKLLAGDYTLNALDPDYEKDLMRPVQRKGKNKLKVRVVDITVRVDPVTAVKARCVFVPVAEYIDQLTPSIMSLSYPLYQTATVPYSLKATELVSALNELDGDIEDDELLMKYINYLAKHKAAPEPDENASAKEKQDYKNRLRNEQDILNEEKRAIYGDKEDAFQPRAGRVAHQWDSLYFHFKEKYEHGTIVDEKDTYDWLGFVVFQNSNEAYKVTAGNAHRFYTIQDNQSVTLPLTGKTKSEREKNRANNQDTRFNINMLRERIIARGAVEAFGSDKSPNAQHYKLWLSSIPDDTRIAFDPPRTAADSESSEATTELFSTLYEYGKKVTSNAFKYIFHSFTDATPSPTKAVDLNVADTKKIQRKFRRQFSEKYANVMEITDMSVSIPLGGDERMRRAYHTEYVVFHNKGMTVKQVKDYAKYLTAKKSSQTGKKKAAVVKAVTKDDKESQFELMGSDDFSQGIPSSPSKVVSKPSDHSEESLIDFV